MGNIRLTESQFHQFLQESIKQVISELDWKTYKNASQKRYQQGDSQAGHDLFKAAQNSFNDDYGYERRVKYDNNSTNFASDETMSPNTEWTPDDYDNTDGRTKVYMDDNGEVTYDSSANGSLNGYLNDSPVNKNRLKQQKNFMNDPERQNHVIKGQMELDNYNDGNYEYQNGEGWKLKESKLDSIISNTIKKFLSESKYDGVDDTAEILNQAAEEGIDPYTKSIKIGNSTIVVLQSPEDGLYHLVERTPQGNRYLPLPEEMGDNSYGTENDAVYALKRYALIYRYTDI